MIATLAVTYAWDPYIFGLALFGLAALSIPVAVVAAWVALSPSIAATRARALVGASTAVTAASLVAAFVVLGTFKWA